jgi:hypothetical protein
MDRIAAHFRRVGGLVRAAGSRANSLLRSRRLRRLLFSIAILTGSTYLMKKYVGTIWANATGSFIWAEFLAAFVGLVGFVCLEGAAFMRCISCVCGLLKDGFGYMQDWADRKCKDIHEAIDRWFRD